MAAWLASVLALRIHEFGFDLKDHLFDGDLRSLHWNKLLFHYDG